ncbi:MAG TPA: 3-isopropylmalate dehydratase small subunit [bacterium]|nr:3-isopropylmalate dehydratase small subunit [bacterium]HQG44529.1 3-isopropylmalate dehydratase small subunit [bacterium]HQI50203.1 3-isopropylmalate dehydratase small subunit [bacterium]HQJ63985.1 3-isopropylmalate dehydratase small subunit [bacterium]
MEKFSRLTSRCVIFPLANIDTDQIIPARFLKGTDKKGLGENLFYDWRYDQQGRPIPEVLLNRPEGKDAKILITGDNFGCGSSREHASWALADYGFRAVISSSFADIFRSNALKNGILPVVLAPFDLDRIMASLATHGDAELTIDLEAQIVTLPDGGRIGFDIDPFSKRCLLDGIDTLGYLLQREGAIAAFESSHPPRVQTRPA